VQGNIEEWGDRICRIKSLEELNSFNSRIRNLPDDIGSLNRLKKVSFWQPLFTDKDPIILLELESIFQKLSKCKSLKTLEINRNGLKEIPESISLLKNLKKFSANENMLTKFPIKLYELIDLKELDLGVNQIYEIPKGIGNLVNLKILKLNSNWKNKLNADNLFNEIDKLKNLESLELWSCESQFNISAKITNLIKLKFVDINNNSVCASQEVFDYLNRLKKFRRWELCAFPRLPKMTHGI
jgi:Leucine-rich repeat (LRR) protein